MFHYSMSNCFGNAILRDIQNGYINKKCLLKSLVNYYAGKGLGVNMFVYDSDNGCYVGADLTDTKEGIKLMNEYEKGLSKKIKEVLFYD